ncbi:HWE histidine kinase domain-containing protein [Aureimonas endophytica]|nr:HWE histidine kinase domain-containing protein [Aureimonas endophytica]
MRALERSGLLAKGDQDQFDRLVGLARDVLGASAVFVSLCHGDEQVFAAQRGLAPELFANGPGLPLAHLICRHVIAGRRPFVVEDLATDVRLVGDPAAGASEFSAYLGVPLFVGGELVGVLAAVDAAPRVWEEADLSRLAAIGRIAGDEIEMRLGETKWRTLFEDMQESFYIAEPIRDAAGQMVDFRYLDVNPAFERLPGRAGAVGRRVRELLPGSAETLIATYRGVADRGETIRLESWTDGEWYEVRARRLDPDRFAVTFHNISERRRHETLAAEADRRYRTLFDSIDEGFCVVEMIFEDGRAVDYRYVELNKAFARQTGLADALGRTMRDLVPDHEEFWFETYGKVARTGEAVRFRQRAAGLEGRWYESYAFRLDGAAPNRVGILFNDISERVAAEDRRGLLNFELAHRLKNTLAIVSSIVTQTLRSAQDVPSARRALIDRIQALSKAHDILLSGQRDAASVAAIVAAAVAIHDQSGRVAVLGSPVQIGPKASLTLSLIIHELATNAVKYGALSMPEGRVEVDWHFREARDGLPALLVIDWREKGGPAVERPARKGFGTRLVEMGLGGGDGAKVEMDYAPDGLRCRIVAPFAEIATADEAEAG